MEPIIYALVDAQGRILGMAAGLLTEGLRFPIHKKGQPKFIRMMTKDRWVDVEHIEPVINLAAGDTFTPHLQLTIEE